jgi:hypothetical protein
VHESLTTRIAEIDVQVSFGHQEWSFGSYEDTQWQGKGVSPALTLKAHLTSLPELDLEQRIFRSGGNWTLYTHKNQWVFLLQSPASGPKPYAMAVINPEFSSGDIYLRELECFDSAAEHTKLNPLEYPLDELLMMHLLSQGRGHLFHACGVEYLGKGFLFAGVSGAGKSTIANLWKGAPGAAILSDDRIIVRRRGSQFWMYGTPWHGDAGVCSPGKVPLEKIFFLEHGNENRINALNAADAASRAVVCSFPTYWNREGMAFALNLCGQLSEEIPCYEMEFFPSPSVLELVTMP